MIILQPNGKYCYYNGKDKKINLSKDDVLKIYFENAKKSLDSDIENAETVIYLIKYNLITEKELKEIGENKPLAEIKKFIPQRVVNDSFCGRDCTTYAKCPTCGASVQNGYGGIDKRCPKCSQVLVW